MKITKYSFSMTVLAATMALSATAAADGMSASAMQVPEQTRSALVKEIEAYRVSHPEAFEAVKNVQGHRPEVYKKFRNPIPLVGRELQRLGSAALLPMLDALLFNAPQRGSLTDQEWTALSVGMIEATGALRDARSGPVLRAVFLNNTKDAKVATAAAIAMGQLCGDDELALLMKYTAAGNPVRASAIQGLGHCRRVESAKHLATLLAAEREESMAQTIAAALGTAASSWTWKALGPSFEATGNTVREIAAKALVDGFVRTRGAVRTEMQKGLILAEFKGTQGLISKARVSVDADTAKALDALTQRMQRVIQP